MYIDPNFDPDDEDDQVTKEARPIIRDWLRLKDVLVQTHLTPEQFQNAVEVGELSYRFIDGMTYVHREAVRRFQDRLADRIEERRWDEIDDVLGIEDGDRWGQ